MSVNPLGGGASYTVLLNINGVEQTVEIPAAVFEEVLRKTEKGVGGILPPALLEPDGTRIIIKV